MSKTMAVMAILAVSIGCGKDKDSGGGEGEATPSEGAGAPAEPEAEAPPEPAEVTMVETDLSPAGIEATIQAPEGATVEEAFGSAEVKLADDSFNLEIATDKADMAARKAEIEKNDINKLKRYVVDEPDAILYESEVMGQNEFHLLVNAEGGESGFECQDSKGPRYTEAQARAMFDACKSIAPKQ